MGPLALIGFLLRSMVARTVSVTPIGLKSTGART
jgi:hypothetical protein